MRSSRSEAEEGEEDEDHDVYRRKVENDEPSMMQKIFTNKNIFYMYGLIDTALYITSIVFLARDNKNLDKHEFLWTGLAIYTPNVLLFLINVFSWNHLTMNWYHGWLRFKLVVQGFVLPLAII